MTTTFEISYYPLNNDYPTSVVGYLKKLKTIPGVEIITNGMSTILIGPYRETLAMLTSLIEDEFAAGDSVFVLKIAPGRREYVE